MACEAHGDGCNPLYVEAWPAFSESFQQRLKTGHVEYTDKVFSKDPEELLLELIQEADDIIGWGFILRYRLNRLLKMVQSVWRPYQRANELLASVRGQNERLIEENARLRRDLDIANEEGQ